MEHQEVSSMGPQNLSKPILKKESHSSICFSNSEINSVRQQHEKLTDLQFQNSPRQKLDNIKRPIFQRSGHLQEVPSNLMRMLKTDTIVNQFRINLLTNSYVMQRTLAKQIHMLFVKSRQSSQALENLQKIPTLKSNGWFVYLWDILGLLISLLILWITPFSASFEMEFDQVGLYEFVIAFLSADILIHLNRDIILKGLIIQQRFQIIMQYLRTRAIIDAACLALWVFQSYLGQQHTLSEFLAILQVVATSTKLQLYIYSNYEQFYLNGYLSSNFFDLLILITQIYFYAHITACVFHYVAANTEHYGITWLQQNGIAQASVWVRYNQAFYWATMTMTTVGYGDVTASNQIEIICATIIMFISTCVFAYSMSSIGIILKNFSDQSLAQRRTLIQITKHMQKNQVAQDIQSKIRNYLNYYMAQQSKESTQELSEILKMLPERLKDELLDDIQNKIIQKSPLIRTQFSAQTQYESSKMLELVQFTPGDLIFKNAQLSDGYLYFLHEGQVQLVEQQSGTIFQTLSEGHACGHYQFFTGLQPLTGAMSVGFSKLYRIHRDKFLQIVQKNQKDFERFHHIKDQILFNHNFDIIDQRCSLCRKSNHMDIGCRLIQYRPDLEQRLKKANFSWEKNNRRQFMRRMCIKMNSRKQISTIEDQIRLYNEQYPSINYEDRNEGAVSEVTEQSSQTDSQAVRIYQVPQSATHRESISTPLRKRESSAQLDAQEKKRASVSPDTYKRYSRCASKLGIDNRGKDQRTPPDEELNFSQISYCIDKVQNYKTYMIQNNVSVLENRQAKAHTKLQRALNKLSKYTFYHQVKLKVLRMKNK